MSKIFFIILIQLTTGCSNLYDQNNRTINSRISQKSPYVILISVDGLRHDYIDKWKPPTLKFLKDNGLSSKSLIPIFPSKTFPNHYSIITGMYAENHGLISNSFYSPLLNKTYSIGNKKEVQSGEWYGGEPLWVTANRNNMVSASYFWVGSEAKIKNSRPDYFFLYDGRVPGETRVDEVINWLNMEAKNRPHFITLYFSEVDSAGHKYGPNSIEVKNALFNIDDYLNRLVTKLAKIDHAVNIVMVSDHGMTEITEKRKIHLPSKITDNTKIKIVGRGALSLIYTGKNQELTKQVLNDLSAVKNINLYTKDNIPKRFHFKENERIPEITVSPKLGYYIAKGNKKVKGGSHGYDPRNKDMHGVFFAIGPNIIPAKIKSFENIHIYPFITSILNISPNPDIDGKKEVLGKYVK